MNTSTSKDSSDELDEILESLCESYYPEHEYNDIWRERNAELRAEAKQAIQAHYARQEAEIEFTTHKKPSRVHSLDIEHISITSSGISFGKNKPPYERVVIEYDTADNLIRFHEPNDEEYGISYKVGKNPASGVYGFRSIPFIGVLPLGYYRKVGEHTYKLTSQAEQRVLDNDKTIEDIK